MNQYNVIGIMSGSSLDGVDICYAEFTCSESWSFHIKKTLTLEIPEILKESLIKSDQLPGLDLIKLDIAYGEWIGQKLNEFITNDMVVDVVGFHGHTTFHIPESKISLQLGKGVVISSVTGLPVVDDFRTKDLLAGGQGAPLVPKGEQLLFGEYDAWINLGGIANITIRKKEHLMAYDIAPCNQVFNHFAKKLGKGYDENGELAKKGNMNENWLQYLRQLPFFTTKAPKSLSNQWVNENILNSPEIAPLDALHSYVSFLSDEIKICLSGENSLNSKVLFTGGGTHNNYLMSSIQRKLEKHPVEIVIPAEQIINFKEALIFGFLALLRKLNIPNTIGEATGAGRDTISGTLYEP